MKKSLTTLLFIFILIGLYITAYLCGVFNEKSTIKALLYGALFLPVLVFEWVCLFKEKGTKDRNVWYNSLLRKIVWSFVLILCVISYLDI